MTKLIGHSMGACLLDMVRNNIKPEGVEVIYTRTRGLDLNKQEHWEYIVQAYGSYYTGAMPHWVDATPEELEKIRSLFIQMNAEGKINQNNVEGPRAADVIWTKQKENAQ